MQSESVLLLSPITALQFVGDCLLSGEGADVHVYTLSPASDSHRAITRNVLRNYCIHGIKPQPGSHTQAHGSLLAVFGAKGLIVLQLCVRDEGPDLRETGQLRELHDWIWDLQWLKGDHVSNVYFGLALGHNSVVLYDYEAGNALREIHCDEKCILYSACFVGCSWAELVLVSGTVFNQLVIWRMEGPTDPGGRVKTAKRIIGHNGVIFSISYLESKGILASASDDRSIRVWNVGNLLHNLGAETSGAASVQCLLKLYGHQSRVWSVKLLEDYIISVGEDSACIVWDYSGEIVNTFKGHKGRSVRALAVNEDQGWVVTGGADSGIRLWTIKEKESEDLAITQLNLGDAEKPKMPKAVKLVDQTRLLVMTDAGGIYCYHLASKEWKLLLRDPSYQSYSLLEVTALPNGSGLCAAGNIKGHIKIFLISNPGDAVERMVYRGKVHSLDWVWREEDRPGMCNLFSSGPDGALFWWAVSWEADRVTSVVASCRYSLPLCKQRWHTSAAFLPEGDFLVCGDRRGSVLLYPCAERPSPVAAGEPGGLDPASRWFANEEETTGAREPASALFGLHGKLGVTSVLCHRGFVYSTGRDGCYRQLRLEHGALRVQRSQRAGGGMDWIERLLLTPGGELVVLGFHATRLVLTSAGTGETLRSIACGGGHRSWSYACSARGETFAYVKSGDVFLCQATLRTPTCRPVVKESLHGREVTCVRLVERARVSGTGPVSVLVASSEDTTLSVLAFQETSGSLSKLTTIGDHISSVRTVAVARAGRGLNRADGEGSGARAVLFSAGGRAELHCCQLLIGRDAVRAGVSCEVAHLASHRLGEEWERLKNRHRRKKTDPETRYMSIAVVDDGIDQGGPPMYFLAAACSDGGVRLFMMDEGQKKILLLAESFYHQRCVLKVETFKHQPTTGQSGSVFLCSAATDGRIVFWDLTHTIERARREQSICDKVHQPWELGAPCFALKSHQCGINSLQVRAVGGERYLVASGGDDNALHVSVISVGTPSRCPEPGQRDQASVRLIRQLRVADAHSAHVTGVRILSSEILASVSVDQRLTHWRLSEAGVGFLQSKHCHVPDATDLDSWEAEGRGSRYFAICGQGLQIFHSHHIE
uniref:tRNA (34-2'-O)-methyltransferase regulator WDR6 n=1 Tax=Callorhinchus milii TaxID=7868 RepID=A0A4W3K3Z3_CALMI|eukprot:gi/632946816/ref/XP_007888745.1/ PREDICTED: WD repeat-containing protein 6 [Callorhinchus milii]